MSKVEITIDGKKLEAEEESMIIEIADAAGIYIPRFCYHEKLSIAANCRMCLVEVDGASKPLPACATPVTSEMVVKTSSKVAVEAQKGTMEFLLINHPLDCPVCDQGGECPLQDQALGYGSGGSRFEENKRAVKNLEIGPLIETEMTRCIHCTRCVRFGQEIAGEGEFGATGRGEHMTITTFMGKSVDSEVSGNVIDLCPVGALTSKPYRFTARAWEMNSTFSISPHDALGSNLIIQTLGDEVKRVLPKTNESVNECWLSDRDRFSYEALNTSDRLINPLIRKEGHMEECSWEDALEVSANRLRDIIKNSGSNSLGGLCSPTATLEEFYLFQKLLRGLGSNNVDHRLRQLDFRDDVLAPIYPISGVNISDIQKLSGVLIVGSNIRKELPLLALRLRHSSKNDGRIATLNPVLFDNNFDTTTEWVVEPKKMASAFAAIARMLAKSLSLETPEELESYPSTSQDLKYAEDIAQSMTATNGPKLLIIGQLASRLPVAAEIRSIARWIGHYCDIHIAILPDANSAAGWIAGCIPHRQVNGGPITQPGLNTIDMTRSSLSALLLFGFEPMLDYASPTSLAKTLHEADFVLNFSMFRSAIPSSANVVLPLAPFTENSGSFLNLEGRLQFSEAAIAPKGLARPGWKILRVLGNMLDLKGFEYVSVDEVSNEVTIPKNVKLHRAQPSIPIVEKKKISNGADDPVEALECIFDIPIYSTDPIVRRAHSLQNTRDNFRSAAYLHPNKMVQLGINSGTVVTVHSKEGSIRLPVEPDERILHTCVYIPTARPETAMLSGSERIWLEIGN